MTHFILSLYHIICITQLIITLVNGETSPDKCISYGPPDFIPSGFHGIFFPTEFGIDPATLYYRMNALQNAITEDVLRDTFSASEVSFNVPATNSDTPQTGLIWGVETTTTNFTLLGYNLFKPNVTGTYTFSVDKVNKDGGGALYIVESAHILCCDTTSMGSLATDKTAYNIPADISHSNLNVTLELDSSRYYVVFIIYANTKGSAQFEMSVTIPDGAKIPDGTGFFGALSDATCNAIRPLKTITSIGDVLSPTTYATSFSSTITVVSGTTLDEYDTIYYVTVPSSTKTASITSTETEQMLLPTDLDGYPIVNLNNNGSGFAVKNMGYAFKYAEDIKDWMNSQYLFNVVLGFYGEYPLNIGTPGFDIPLQGTLEAQNVTLYDTNVDISNDMILYKGVFEAPVSGNYKLSVDYNGISTAAALFPVGILCEGIFIKEVLNNFPDILQVVSYASGPDFSASVSNTTYLTAGQQYIFVMAYENVSVFPGYNRTTNASFHPSLTFPNGEVFTDFSNIVHSSWALDETMCDLHVTKTVEYPWTGSYSTVFTTNTYSTPTVIVTNLVTQTMYRYDIDVYALVPPSSSIDSSTLISSSSSISATASSSIAIPSSTSSFLSSVYSSLQNMNSSISSSSYPTNSSQLWASSSTPLNPVHSSNIASSVYSIPTDRNSTIPVSQYSATVSHSSAIVSNSSSYASIVSSIRSSQVVQISSTPNREIISSNNSISSAQLNTPPSIASTRKTSLFASTAVYSESARFGNTTHQELSTTSIHFSETTTIAPSHSMMHDGASKVTSITYGEEISRLSELSNDIFTTSTYVDSQGFTITTIINCSNNIDNSNSAVKSESLYLNTMQTTTAVTTAVLQDTVVTDTTKQNVPTTTKTSSVVQYGPHSNSISIGSSSLPTAALFSPENENNAIKNSSQMMILLLPLLHILTFI